MPYQWLLFDADGTLFDYDAAESSALRNAFRIERLAFSPDIESAYQQINKQLWKDFEQGKVSSLDLRVQRFEQLFMQFKLSIDPHPFSRLYLACLAQSSQLIDGAQELIFQLRAQGYHLAIVTNGIADVQRSRLGASAIAGCFEGLFISEELGSVKPAPAYFAAVFQQIGNPPKADVLVIGDSLSSDIRGGQTYQLDTCWYCSNPASAPALPADLQPTYTIHTLAEIHALLQLH